MHLHSGNTASKTPKLYGLDHLRALAIVLVFLFHYRGFQHPDWIDDVSGFGWTGVDLFFVLSGFLIAGQLFAQLKSTGRIALGDFFIKRFFRIIPPYLIVLTVYFSIPFFREREALAPLWKFLTFTHNFGLDVIHRGTFSHAWSLCIEEQFYLTLPFLLLFTYNRKGSPVLRVLFGLLLVMVIALRLFSWNVLIAPFAESDAFALRWYKYLYYPTYTRLDGLLLGVGLAWLMQHTLWIRDRILLNGNLFFAAGIPFLTAAWRICREPASFEASIWGFILVAIGFACWVAAAASPVSFLYKKSSWITAQMASLSFTVYLSHKGVVHMTQVLLKNTRIAPDSNTALLIAATNCILVALLFRYLVEQPCLRIRNHLLNRRKSTGIGSRLLPATSAQHSRKSSQ